MKKILIAISTLVVLACATTWLFATDASDLKFRFGITATPAELNIMDGVTSTAAELNVLDGIMPTVAELNYIDGVTSAIQTQLNAKQTLDATLTSVAALGTAADKLAYTTGVDTWAEAALTAAGRAVLDDANAAAQLVTLGLTANAAELNQYAITVDMTDISTAASVWVVAPHAGDIAAIYSVINGAIITADATITAEIGGTLVTGSSITIAFTGSAAGIVDSSAPSAANTVTAGQAIEIITNGGSTNVVRATFTILITR